MCKQESASIVVLSVVFPHAEIILRFAATILAFPFTDPVEDLLLTGLDDSFVSRPVREAAELVWSV